MWWLVNDVAVLAQGVARWGSFFHGLALAVDGTTLNSVQVCHFKGENARVVGTTLLRYNFRAVMARRRAGNFAFVDALADDQCWLW